MAAGKYDVRSPARVKVYAPNHLPPDAAERSNFTRTTAGSAN